MRPLSTSRWPRTTLSGRASMLGGADPHRVDRDLLVVLDRAQIVARVARGVQHRVSNGIQAVVLAARGIAAGATGAAREKLELVLAEESGRVAASLEALTYVLDPGAVAGATWTVAEAFRFLEALQPCKKVAPAVGLEVAVAPEAAQLRVAAPRVVHILLALVLNACEAQAGRQRGRVRLDARTERGMLLVVVEDQGPGVPARLREKIFEPGFTTRRGKDRLGIGLSAARMLARAEGGEVSLTEPGELGGARFEVRVRARRSWARKQKAPPAPPPAVPR